MLFNLSIRSNPEIIRLDSDKAKTFRFVDKDKSIGPEEMMHALIHGSLSFYQKHILNFGYLSLFFIDFSGSGSKVC